MQHTIERTMPAWAVALFVVLALGGAWAVASPLWTSGQGLGHPLTGLLLPAMMFVPAAAAVLVLLVLGRHRPAPVLTFLGVWPLRPARRVVGWTLSAAAAGILFVAATVALAGATGWLPLDLAGLSGFRAFLRASGADAVPIPAQTLLAIQLGAVIVNTPFVALLTVGEELGWRGFLVPALRPRGRWVALLVSGAVWGLWHAPIVLLGYDFGRTDWIGVVEMVVACTLLGVLLGWLRLRTGSVWSAVFAHAGINAAAGIGVYLSAAGTSISTLLRNPLGVPGWILLALVIGVLVSTGRIRREDPLETRPPPSAASSGAMPSAERTDTP